MSEWGVFLVVSALLAFTVSVATPVIKLNSSITRLNVTIENIIKEQGELKEGNSESHRRIWSQLDGHSHQITELDKRTTKLEGK